MDGLPPWFVDGVEPEAQEAAKLSARKAGLPLGTWLSHTILTTATSELKRDSQVPGLRSGPLPPALPSEVVLDSIQRLAIRIEAAEARTVESIRPLADKVQQLSQRVEEVSARGKLTAAPMERALIRMTERLEQLETEGVNGRPVRRGLFFR